MFEYCPICGHPVDPSHDVRVCTVCDWFGDAGEVVQHPSAMAEPIADLQEILNGHRVACQAFQSAVDRKRTSADLTAIENNVRDIEQLVTNLFIRIINAAINPHSEKTSGK